MKRKWKGWLRALQRRVALGVAPSGSRLLRPRTLALEGSPAGDDAAPLRFAWDGDVIALAKEKQQAMARVLAARTGCRVQAGPFRGLRYIDDVTWGDLGSKLLGTYEEELHAVIERFAARDYEAVVNVGCAEGYYAAGLGMRMPGARIIACDTDPRAQSVCRELLEQNGLAERSDVLGEVDPDRLSALLGRAGRSLVVADCEGYESTLIDPKTVPELASCDVLAECHDFLDRGITPMLEARFHATHTIERIDEQPRNPWKSPWLGSLGAFDAHLMICEFRPEPMHWLVLETRQ